MTERSNTIRLLYAYKLNHRWENNIKMEYISISTSDSICSGKYIGNLQVYHPRCVL